MELTILVLCEGMWKLKRGDNLLDTGSPQYEVYKTKDGEFMSVGALEQQFYDALLKVRFLLLHF